MNKKALVLATVFGIVCYVTCLVTLQPMSRVLHSILNGVFCTSAVLTVIFVMWFLEGEELRTVVAELRRNTKVRPPR